MACTVHRICSRRRKLQQQILLIPSKNQTAQPFVIITISNFIQSTAQFTAAVSILYIIISQMKKNFNDFFNKKTENNPCYFGRRQKSANKISTAPPAPFGKKHHTALLQHCNIAPSSFRCFTFLSYRPHIFSDKAPDCHFPPTHRYTYTEPSTALNTTPFKA